MPFVNTKMTDSGGSASQMSAYKAAGKTADKYAHEQVVNAINNYLNTAAAVARASNITALSGPTFESTGKAVDTLVDKFSNIGSNIKTTVSDIVKTGSNIINNGIAAVSNIGSSSSSSGSGGYGSGSGGYGSGLAYGAGIGSYNDILNMVNDTAQKNNEWSAQQAQFDRDWQKMMSDTAHQREVADLQAAGLNPVLSAGGSGASTPSGAMGQTDTSNTRILAEVMMTALGAMSNTAIGCATAASGNAGNVDNSVFGRITNAYSNNKLVKKLVDTGLNTAASIARLGIVKAIL